jgi:hypothetical protein
VSSVDPVPHRIRRKVELLNPDYMDVLGVETIAHVQRKHSWYFHEFGYELDSV